MDGENNGKPLLKFHGFGGKKPPNLWKHPSRDAKMTDPELEGIPN